MSQVAKSVRLCRAASRVDSQGCGLLKRGALHITLPAAASALGPALMTCSRRAAQGVATGTAR